MLDLTGLDELPIASLLQTPVSAGPGDEVAGSPVRIALDRIDFDPTQPRKRFRDETLAELAATIAVSGVLQPISVHRCGGDASRFVVNLGERRVRAARLAGLAEIPAYIEAPLDGYARVIENLAREDLTPFELARFIADETARGVPRGVIAHRLGKPKSFVSELSSLADAPATVQSLYDEGHCRDVRTLYLLVRASRVDAAAVRALVESPQSITRERVEAVLQAASSSRSSGIAAGSDDANTFAASRAPRKSANAFLVDVAGRAGFMKLGHRTTMSTALVVFKDGSTEAVELNRIRLIQWTTLP